MREICFYGQKGYRVVSSAVYFCIDDVLNKFYCVIGNSMNLRAQKQENVDI